MAYPWATLSQLTSVDLNAAIASRLPLAGGTITGNLVVTGTITGSLGSYLPLSGGILSGGLTGTSATFSGNLQAAGATFFAVSGTGSVTVGAGSTNHLVLSATALGTAPSLTGTGDSGLRLSTQNSMPILLGGNYVWAGPDSNSLIANTTASGTSTGSSPFVNSFVVNDTVDRSIATTTPFKGFNIQHNYGGGTTKGGRTALDVLLLQQAGANTDTGADNFYVGSSSATYARYTQPGSSTTTPLGRVFGFAANGQIQAGFTATNYYQVAGVEFNVAISAGSSAALRSGVTIADLGGVNQGFWTDNMLWLYGAGQPWRYGICFGDTQPFPIDATVGTLMGSKYGTGKNGATFAAKWGVDLHQILFPSTGNPYDGGPFRSNGFAVDGIGKVQVGSNFITPSSSGLTIDTAGSVGVSATIATAGSGYESGVIVFGSLGGIWTLPVVAGVPTGVPTVLVQPVISSLSPPANPVTPTQFNRSSTGTGLAINIVWNTTATTLALNPSAGATTVGGTLTAPSYRVGANQVVASRSTGWGAATNGAKTAFNGSTATLAQTSAALAQIIADLTVHGLIGT